jgi:hypothetical protein
VKNKYNVQRLILTQFHNLLLAHFQASGKWKEMLRNADYQLADKPAEPAGRKFVRLIQTYASNQTHTRVRFGSSTSTVQLFPIK